MVEPIVMSRIGIPADDPPSPRSQQYLKKSCYFLIALLSLIAFLDWAYDCAEVKYAKDNNNTRRTITNTNSINTINTMTISDQVPTTEDIEGIGIVSIGITDKCTGTGDTITGLLGVASAFISATILILWNYAPLTAATWCARASNALFVLLVAAAILGTESHSGTEVWLGIAAFPAFLLAISSWKNININTDIAEGAINVPSPLVVGRYPDRNSLSNAAPELQPLVGDRKN